MSKPIAKVTVLATGPTHYLNLPVAGKTSFTPGSSLLVYDQEDLDAIKAAIPSSQLKVREFPHILDAQESVSESVVEPVAQKGSKRTK